MSERIRSALSHIPADDRDTWVTMAMACKAELGEDGHSIWDQWSQTADNYRPDSAKAVWRSVKGSGGVGSGTLFKTAMDHGWRDDGSFRRATPAEIAEQRRKSAQRDAEEARERTAAATKAAKKAAWIMERCKVEKHSYLDAHGWPDAVGLVWMRTETENILCIPMMIGDELVGMQMIDRDGSKRFLTGQRTKGTEFVIGQQGLDFWVEGWATGQSVFDCLSVLKIQARIHICFSAGNLAHMAKSGFVIADHDASETGEKAAKATGLPYFMPEVVGEDFCDQWKREGTFRTSQKLRKFLQSAKIV